MRKRCDQFDVAAIRAAIASGETSERQAYLAYASTAGRPYSRSTFSVMLRAKPSADAALGGAVAPTPDNLPPTRSGVDRWRDHVAVKPRIIALGLGGGLRVQRGALVAFDPRSEAGAGGETKLTYTKAAKPPLAIVLSSAGGFVSIEAVRFCARAHVAIVALDRAHGFLTIMTGAPKASARMVRAQVRANPVPIARAIVAAKIAAMQKAGAIADARPYLITLMSAPGVVGVRIAEAQASRAAWPDGATLRWEAGAVPPEWKAPWLMRSRLDARTKWGESARVKRHARHPINAMLNAAFAVTAGRLAAYLAALGLAPAIGFLHADKPGRQSLAWDAIEPLRPMIEARLFRFISSERFAASDFKRSPDGSLRLAPGCLSAVLNASAPPSHVLAGCVRQMARLIGEAAADRQTASDAGFRIEPEPRQAGRF